MGPVLALLLTVERWKVRSESFIGRKEERKKGRKEERIKNQESIIITNMGQFPRKNRVARDANFSARDNVKHLCIIGNINCELNVDCARHG
jgi:hypothetical protein